ncbi:amidohydrolase [Neobacillus massiliamazoniensis]|uniref:Amidohydrolase family protein n=1 Tax=Neobacillus massiliamazoniensis TaxID=1499688 RepID=A0A0U1NVW9_9BACI|nr:amidohydrolase family protein [Neobacillus massiliamazoniensis]
MKMNQKADIILSSNAVFTGLTDKPIPAYIAIINNKIAAIGSEKEINAFIGLNTKIHHFSDQMIMAGFHDFHLHMLMGSLAEESVFLADASSEEDTIKMVLDFANSRPDDPWIIGFSWDQRSWDNNRLPNRATLDRVLPDRPVLLFHMEGHYVWVNSKALEIANINRNTDNPPHGIIAKDENGEPTGILYETANALVTYHAFNFSKERLIRMMKNFLEQTALLGVTSVNDLYGSPAMEKLQDYKLFADLDKNGELTARIHLSPPLNDDLENAKQLRDTYTSSKLQVSGLKQFVDGVISGYTACLLEPYADKPETSGETVLPPDTLKKWIIEADREGFQIRLHAIGDGAIRLALDAFEEAQKINGKRDSRHCIEHVEVIHPDDSARFKKLGVIASMQPEHLGFNEEQRQNYISYIGPEREPFVFAMKTLKDSGALLALGTDYPIAQLNPMLGIYRALTRMGYDGTPSEGFNPQERLSLPEVLRDYTLSPAYGSFREKELGTLEVGKLADLVVLDRNLFEIPVEDIPDVRVVLTMVDGAIVFQNEMQVIK